MSEEEFQIIESLDFIKKEIGDVKINAGSIATLVEERNRTAIEWRASVCDKFRDVRQDIKEIKDVMAKLPCDSTLTRLDALDKIGDRTGKVIAWGIISLISFAVLWGSLLMRVEVNTKRIDKVEQSHSS